MVLSILPPKQTLNQNTLANAPDALLDEAYRKISRRLLPALFLCYLIAYIDRTNISFAKLTLIEDIHLSEAQYGLAAGLFFAGYVLFEIPSNMILVRVGARRTLVPIMLLWGLAAAGLALARTPGDLYLGRFVLGAAEAGFFPGVILYLTFWFPARLRARITAQFMMATVVAGIIGSPVSALILQLYQNYHGLHGWQWLFLLEAIPAFVMAAILPLLLSDKPQAAPWLTNAEKQAIALDLSSVPFTRESRRRAGFSIFNREILLISAVNFTIICGTNVTALWTPTLLRQAGVTSLLAAGGLSTFVWIGAALAMQYISVRSDLTMERRWHVAAPMLMAALSLSLLTQITAKPLITTMLLTIAAGGIYAAIAVFWTVPQTYLSSKGSASGIALTSSIGALGGLASPLIIGGIHNGNDGLHTGMLIVAALIFAGALLLLVTTARHQAQIRID